MTNSIHIKELRERAGNMERARDALLTALDEMGADARAGDHRAIGSAIGECSYMASELLRRAQQIEDMDAQAGKPLS
jgi:hypothetical protein